MMVSLPADTWIRLIVWMVIGLVVYFLYGRSHSVLGRTGRTVGEELPPESTYTENKGE